MQVCFLFLLFGLFSAFCPGDLYCQQCGPNNTCVYCAYSYPDETGTCVPHNAVPYCYSYENATWCNECQDHTFQDIDNQKCIPLDPTIRKTCLHAYNSTTECDTCPKGILAVNGSCNTSTTCTDPNCYACYWDVGEQRQSCWICSKGYVLWSATVFGTACFRGVNMTGCYSSTQVGKCGNCNIGYYITETGCARRPELDYNVPDSWAGKAATAVFFLISYQSS